MIVIDIFKTAIPCECGGIEISISAGLVGFVESSPRYEAYGKCTKCGKSLSEEEMEKRFFKK